MLVSDARASAFRRSCQGFQQLVCSQACPVGATPKGRRTSPDRSAPPHQQQVSGSEATGCALSHSTIMRRSVSIRSSSRTSLLCARSASTNVGGGGVSASRTREQPATLSLAPPRRAIRRASTAFTAPSSRSAGARLACRRLICPHDVCRRLLEARNWWRMRCCLNESGANS